MKTKQQFLTFLLLCGAIRLSAVEPLSVTPGGVGPFTYQWYRNADSSNTGGEKIEGATSSTYTPVNEGGAYYYYCLITNDCKSVASNVSGLHSIFTISDCNSHTPDFKGGTLGDVTYGNAMNKNPDINATNIEGHNIKQTWSAHVFAEGCNKTSFAGGVPGSNNSDCRRSHATDRNYTGYGDLFSWCAVAKYRDVLCPSPWRVPTKQDFMNLDIALGGTGENRDSDSPAINVRAKYVAPSGAQGWAGAWGGNCGATGGFANQGEAFFYWSASESSTTIANAYSLRVSSTQINPSAGFGKLVGFALRCVK